MIEFRYRPDIDGLRGIAVVLVLLYHAGLGFTGGFIGVDVFFVISGFVITGLILKQQDSENFRLANFWMRRIRRILPASMLVVIVSLIFGGVFLFPGDFEKLAISAFYQQLMLSNVYFWMNTGYFDGPAELNPLLHTWSLAVEEQFYLAYPFFLVFMRRFKPSSIAATLILLMIVSFGASEWAVRNHPLASFFLLPTRAWELLAGAVLCFLPLPKSFGPRSCNIISLVGLGGILWSALLFDSSTRFPGAAALLPCVGTALLVFSNERELTWLGRMLASKPLVFVGLISYSLYLWHWPILSFAKLTMKVPPSKGLCALALLMSFGLAYLSWRFVEMPFRNGVILQRNRGLLILTTAAVALIICSSFAIGKYDGFPSRIAPNVERYYSASKSKAFTNSLDVATVSKEELQTFGDSSGRRKCMVWGDSHAMALIPPIDEICKTEGIIGYQATYSATPPILNFIQSPTRFGLGVRAPVWNQAVFEFAKENEIRLVIISGVWSTYANTASFETSLIQTVNHFSNLGVHLIIVRDVPRHNGDVPLLLARTLHSGRDVKKIGIPVSEHHKRNEQANIVLDNLATMAGVTVLDPLPYLVDSTGLCRAEFDGTALYRDAHHLSIEGAMRLVPLFSDAISSLNPPR